ncbi:MAG: aminodeoxychorismate/anthranilate synthase component II [Actinobacteria bacterium]|nr:aminodeoxychorismate/anthranilate synthase component II [Actinomycetota bacterium]
MILVIDNYDSFVYNLVQYLGDMGHEITTYRNDAVEIDEVERINPSHIVISPGPGTPDDAGMSVELVRYFTGKIPILGVCLGHQSIARAFGAKVIRSSEICHGKISEIFHDGRTIFRDVKNPFVAGRYHSLIVDGSNLPGCLEVSARTKNGLVMGIRCSNYRVEGVQFHPESILTADGKMILENFLRL